MTSEFLDRLKTVDPVWGVTIGAATLALGWILVCLGDRGLWWDELWTVGLAAPTTPGPERFEIIRNDVHPPLYYLGVAWWLAQLNSSAEWAARSFNFFALGIEICGAIWAARNRVAAPLAIWCALFFTSFGLLWYLQDARMYTFLICQSFLACIFALVYEQVRNRPLTWQFSVIGVLVFVVMPFTHWFAGLFGGLILFGLFVSAVLERRAAYAGLFFGLGVALGTLVLAWAWFNWQSTLGFVGEYGGGRGLVRWEIRQALVGTLLFAFTLNPILLLAAFAGIVFLLQERPRRLPPLLILTCVGATIAVIFTSSIKSPMYQTRNFTWFIAPATLFAAFGLARVADWLRLETRQIGLALGALLALNLLTARAANWTYPLERDEWRQAGRYLLAQPGCANVPIPVMMQWLNRRRAEIRSELVQGQRLYGYYGGGPNRFLPIYQEDTRLPGPSDGNCAVILWIAQMSEENARAKGLELLGPAFADTRIVRFAGQSLFVRDTTTSRR